MTRDRKLSWINGLLLPLFNVLTAFIATGIVFIFIGVEVYHLWGYALLYV